jgi:hypothetical protein
MFEDQADTAKLDDKHSNALAKSIYLSPASLVSVLVSMFQKELGPLVLTCLTNAAERRRVLHLSWYRCGFPERAHACIPTLRRSYSTEFNVLVTLTSAQPFENFVTAWTAESVCNQACGSSSALSGTQHCNIESSYTQSI